MTETQQLQQLLIERSVRRGGFILASGKSSSIYVDARLTTMSPEGMNVIGPLSLHAMEVRGWAPDSVGGLTLGADPVAFAIAFSSADGTRPLRAFTVRKEVKAHGTGNLIEGPFRPDDKVVVIEDVITSGKSALQAIDAISRAGAQVLGVLAVVNRDEGGVEAIAAKGFDTLCLTSIRDLAS
ncbi:MAG: orotate phosphoribosyltransferase [Gemmatimonadaceae bacterium]